MGEEGSLDETEVVLPEVDDSFDVGLGRLMNHPQTCSKDTTKALEVHGIPNLYFEVISGCTLSEKLFFSFFHTTQGYYLPPQGIQYNSPRLHFNLNRDTHIIKGNLA